MNRNNDNRSGYKTFRLRRETKENDLTVLEVKVINKLNYVVHTVLKLDPSGLLVGTDCDGTDPLCGRGLCVHCRAAADHLNETGRYRILTDDFMSSLNAGTTDQTDRYRILTDDLLSSINSVKTDPADKVISETKTGAGPDTQITEDIAPVSPLSSGTDNDRDAVRFDGSINFCDDPVSKDDGNNEFIPSPGLSIETSPPREMTLCPGTDVETEKPLYIYPNNTSLMLHNNMGVIGTMGTGKTQLIKSLIVQTKTEQQNNYYGSPVGWMIFDYKGDYNDTKPEFVNAAGAAVTRAYHIPYNPFALSIQKNSIPLLPLHTANSFTDTVSRIYNLGPKQSMFLCDCIMEAYKKAGIDKTDRRTWTRIAPTFADVYRIYENSRNQAAGDSLTAVMTKLHTFEIFEPVRTKTVPFTGLMDKITVFDLSAYDEDIRSLVIAITLDCYYSAMQSLGSSLTDGRLRQLRGYILIDEADNFMKKGVPSLKKIMKEGREFGVGVILSTQSLSHFSGAVDDYSRYILTWIIHNVNDLTRSDIETILKQPKKSPQSEQLFFTVKGLKKHHSIVRLSDGLPVVIKDKPFWQLMEEQKDLSKGEVNNETWN